MIATCVNYGDRDLALGNEIIRTLVGSTVHGLAIDGQDDRDETGIYIPPATYLCGLERPETYIWRTQPEGARSGPGDIDLVIYTLRRWMELAVAGNPSILTLLFVPDDALIVRSELGDRLRALAPSILSRQAGHRFLGYLHGQRQRLLGGGKQNRVPKRPELIEKYGFDVKYAGHALRLGLQGVELMRTGRITLPMPKSDRSTVLAVRRGERPFTETLTLIDEAAHTLSALVADVSRSPLRERPDMTAVNRFLVEAHRGWWAWSSDQHDERTIHGGTHPPT